MNNIHICMASDSNYAPFMCSCIASILINSDKDDYINMHIIDVGISEKDKYKIATLKEIKNFKIKYYIPNIEQYKNWFGKMDNKAHFSYAMFARLSIPNLIEEDKILYLDCDIIVNKSLNELFNTDISDYHCVVVRRIKDPIFLEEEKLLIGLSKEDYYFNSGVLLINNKLWKENNIFDKFLDYINNGGKLLWGDQAILNVVLRNKIRLIEEKYNFECVKRYHFENKIYDTNNLVILHYIADQKPWKEYCLDLLFIEKFWEYFCITPYFRENTGKYIQIMINQRINNLELRLKTTYSIDKLIDTLAWWIPTKKLRNNFRNKFKIAEQSRAEQSRAEQSRAVMFEYAYRKTA